MRAWVADMLRAVAQWLAPAPLDGAAIEQALNRHRRRTGRPALPDRLPDPGRARRGW